ncbi:CheY-like chemotaxis protein [Streptomyces sp. SLBN-8D4]
MTDDGTARQAPQRDGRGLPGMRERVTLYAGTLEAGPSESGGFRVHARLPVGPSPLPPATGTTVTDLHVVGTAGTGREAVATAAEHRPDVVLVDVRMPDMDGIEATRRITAAGHARVLVLTTFDLDEYLFGALRAGASSFLLKDAPPDDLHAAIRTVATGDALLAPGLTRRLIAAYIDRPAPRPRGQPLTAPAIRHQPRTRGPSAHCRRTVQRRDRRPALHRRRDREDPRGPAVGQTRRPRPRTPRHSCLPHRSDRLIDTSGKEARTPTASRTREGNGPPGYVHVYADTGSENTAQNDVQLTIDTQADTYEQAVAAVQAAYGRGAKASGCPARVACVQCVGTSRVSARFMRCGSASAAGWC